MKLNRLETHDRYQHFIKDQSINIFKGVEECLKENQLSLAIQERSPYVYLFAHPRTADDGVNKRMLWQPRLSIPEAQENSYLFRAISKTDMIEVCWLLPPKATWDQFKKGNITESDLVSWSINQFKNRRFDLEAPHPDDMPEEKAREIMKAIVDERREDIRSRRVISKLETLLNG